MTTAPAGEAEAVNAEAGQALKRGSSVTDSTDVETEPRNGDLIRGVLKRTSSGGCFDCGLTFDNIGGACAHARSARHRIHVDYAASYIYLPAETIPGGLL
jgi:hypothetical protein